MHSFDFGYQKIKDHHWAICVCFIFFISCLDKPGIHQIEKDVLGKDNTPNIVLINVDDLGWTDLGYTGSQFYNSPNIDRLARHGMVFTNGYATASNCAPSRACMLTGQWSPRHGVYTVSPSTRGNSKDRKLIPTKNTDTLSYTFKLLPQVLKENGYKTCHAGKWHVSRKPEDFGIDLNIGGSKAGHPKSYYPPYKNVDMKTTLGKNLTDLIMENAIEFVKQTEEPYFLYYSPYAVHTPIQAIDSLVHKYKNKPSWKGQSNIEYATMIENVDRNIGLLFNVLQTKGDWDNTLIIFSSDNGGRLETTFNKPLRAGKGSYYEGGIRVPIIFSWPGHIEPGTRSDYPISNLDFFPTIMEMLGIDSGLPTFDGESIYGIVKNDATNTLSERSLYWHFPFYLQANRNFYGEIRDSLFRTRPGSAIRYGDWKLHHYLEDDAIELYNLTEDIGERNNLADINTTKRDELYGKLNEWRKKVNAPIPSELNPEYIPTIR